MLNGWAEGTESAGEGASAQALEMKTPALFSIFLHRLVLCTHTCEALTGVPFWLSGILQSTSKKRNGHRRKGSLTLAWSDLASQIWLTVTSLHLRQNRAQAHPLPHSSSCRTTPLLLTLQSPLSKQPGPSQMGKPAWSLPAAKGARRPLLFSSAWWGPQLETSEPGQKLQQGNN